MSQKLQPTIRPLVALLLASLLSVVAFARRPSEIADQQTTAAKTGILLLAHGGSQKWNDEVNKLAAEVNETLPIEVAFGMATKRTMQSAVDRLAARGVREIVAVPLFISSHSSVITSTQYLLGARKDAPPQLAIYARMDHSAGADHSNHSGHSDPAVDPMTPVKSPVPIRMAAALDRHPLVADILLTRARSISHNPVGEVVVVVAHGPVSDAENAQWLADMGALVKRMKKASRFQRIDYLTVRDDAPEPLRSQATAELRRVVERATGEGRQVLIVPLLLSFGGIEAGIKKRLEGLRYTMASQALLPDARLIQWVRLATESATAQ
jgi:sirohydrochlorin ferrochelatase